MSPESRITIEEYMYDPAKGKRNAVLQMFQGLALFVVSKIHQTEQPDFVVKTHTAIMGIRGTEVGIRLQPNESTFLTFSGLIRVSSNFAEISGYVDGKAGQGITARGGLPPTLPFEITDEDRQLFMRQLATGLTSRARGKDSGSDSLSSEGNQLGQGLSGDLTSISVSPVVKPTELQPPSTSNPPPSTVELPPPPPIVGLPPPPPIVELPPPPPPPAPTVSGPPYGPPSSPLAGPPGQSFQPPGPPSGGPPSGGPPYGHAYGHNK